MITMANYRPEEWLQPFIMGKIARFVRKFRGSAQKIGIDLVMAQWDHETKIATMQITREVDGKDISWEVELTLDDVVYLRYPVLERYLNIMANL